MRISGLGIDQKKAVVILGAGASRGAQCFKNSLLPAPLDTDFFSLMEHVQHHDDSLRDLLSFVKSEFGENAFLRMEELFTQLEALSEFHEHLKIKRGPKIVRYQKQLDNFVANVACFFRYIFFDATNSQLRTCKYHDRLAEVLHAEDAIVTFNYDCLIDDALRRKAGRTWNPSQSYGIELADKATTDWRPNTSLGRPVKKPIALLKLHGSLNWDRSRGNDQASLFLRLDPYDNKKRMPAEVVPPVWDKTISKDPVLKEIWKEARRILPTGPILIVVGYSVPATDLLSQALIRVAASERATDKKMSHLIVVNPDTAARRRMVQLVQGGMNAATTVIELQNMSELHKLLS